MISGSRLSDAIRFVDLLHKDVSYLIDAVDSGVQAIDHVSLWSACYFGASKSVNYSKGWNPHAFTRVYVPQSEVRAFSGFAFFNVYLTPKNLSEPVAHWGVGRRRSGVDIWTEWNPKLLGAGGPGFLRTSEVQPFESCLELANTLEVFRHAVKPLIEINTADELERVVLGPLRLELARLGSSVQAPDEAPRDPDGESRDM